MENDHTGDQERHQIVKGEEAVQRRVVDREAAPEEDHNALADKRDGREQVGDHRRAPEAHLTPRKNIPHEGRGHHQKEDDDAEHPQQFARCLVGAVIQSAEHMNVNDDEEEARRIHVDVADQPAVIDVTHDALDRADGVVDMSGVDHRQHNAGDDHDHQRKAGKNTEVPHVVEVLRNRIVVLLVIKHGEHGKTVVNPPHDRI